MTGCVDIRGTTFRDNAGRHLILRGVNLGGDCKLPSSPNGQTHITTDFADHRSVSFVGRPAPLDEIDSHLARIAHWGFNCLRLLTTWEAVEHGGPGVYDEACEAGGSEMVRDIQSVDVMCRKAGLLKILIERPRISVASELAKEEAE